MTYPSDFQEEPTPSTSQSSATSVPLSLGRGCGCFGLILFGIIATIALPSYFAKVEKIKQAEGRNSIWAITRAQQAYHMKKGTFSNSLDGFLTEGLDVGVCPETENYRYQIVSQPDNRSVKITAQAKSGTLKSYTGALFAIQEGAAATKVTGICATDSPSTTPPAMPKLTGNGSSVECPPGSRPL
jgi:type II secretory pathway pseudopilin PulG